jgi:hypothetical protein
MCAMREAVCDMNQPSLSPLAVLREVLNKLREEQGHVDDGYCLACDSEPDQALADVQALVDAARELRESLRIETYSGVKYKLLCPRCGGLGEVGPENHDDPKSWPCSDCEGLGVRKPVLAAIRAADAALARFADVGTADE